MRRHRRQAPGELKRKMIALDDVSVTQSSLKLHLKHRQLKADLELMKLEKKLLQQIRWLQTRRLDQLNKL